MQTVTPRPRHHVYVQVRNTLTDRVVVRHERSRTPQLRRHFSADVAHPLEERSDVVDGQVSEGHHMSTRHDERVPVKQRGTVEERNNQVIGEHDVRFRTTGPNVTENTITALHHTEILPREHRRHRGFDPVQPEIRSGPWRIRSVLARNPIGHELSWAIPHRSVAVGYNRDRWV